MLASLPVSRVVQYDLHKIMNCWSMGHRTKRILRIE
nr:MAG TPA: hypothetical protein [Caudoviricetes sp.]